MFYVYIPVCRLNFALRSDCSHFFKSNDWFPKPELTCMLPSALHASSLIFKSDDIVDCHLSAKKGSKKCTYIISCMHVHNKSTRWWNPRRQAQQGVSFAWWNERSHPSNSNIIIINCFHRHNQQLSLQLKEWILSLSFCWKGGAQVYGKAALWLVQKWCSAHDTKSVFWWSTMHMFILYLISGNRSSDQSTNCFQKYFFCALNLYLIAGHVPTAAHWCGMKWLILSYFRFAMWKTDGLAFIIHCLSAVGLIEFWSAKKDTQA